MATKFVPLPDRLKRLREKRGWTVHGTCRRTDFKVKRETLMRLEDGTTDPQKVPVKTLTALVDVFWPDLDLPHFVGEEWVGKKERYSIIKKVDGRFS